MADDHYVGTELELFRHAQRWKAYWSSLVRPWIGGDVLEVGAGIGANTTILQTARVRSWRCLEPDPELARQAKSATAGVPHCSVAVATVATDAARQYDTIVYIDVLEHIERDRDELARAASILRPTGHLIVLAPAWQGLYSPFDKAIGHYRRYNRAALRAKSPAGCRLEQMAYLDSVGVMLSLLNRTVARKPLPTLRDILIWDRWVVPMSKRVDRLVRFRFGKSILAIWTKW